MHDQRPLLVDYVGGHARARHVVPGGVDEELHLGVQLVCRDAQDALHVFQEGHGLLPLRGAALGRVLRGGVLRLDEGPEPRAVNL